MLRDDTKKSVLLRLHDQIDESRAELTSEEMVQGFKPPIDPLEVDFALAKLVESGLAVTVSGYPLSYRISRVGIGEVESGYKITTTVNPSTGITHRTYSEIPKKSATAEQAFDWGKSGAIAAWIGIPIAIVAIAITIWLDK